MIKVLYDGYMVRDMYNNYHSYSTVGKLPEPVNEYFHLRDDDIKRFNDFGKVKIHAVIGERLDEYDMLIWEEGDALPLVQYSGCFTDRQGNETPFEIIKGENTYSQDNDNQLKIFFDDKEQKITPENSIDTTENNAPFVQHDSKLKEKINLLNLPTRQDDWLEVINVMANEFYAEYGELPTAAQAWNALCNTPPAGYVITTNKNDLMMAGCKSLSKRNFNDRWREYTKQSQNHQTENTSHEKFE